MKLAKAARRDKKRNKRRHGMRVSGKGYTHIQNAIIKRSKKRRKK